MHGIGVPLTEKQVCQMCFSSIWVDDSPVDIESFLWSLESYLHTTFFDLITENPLIPFEAEPVLSTATEPTPLPFTVKCPCDGPFTKAKLKFYINPRFRITPMVPNDTPENYASVQSLCTPGCIRELFDVMMLNLPGGIRICNATPIDSKALWPDSDEDIYAWLPPGHAAAEAMLKEFSDKEPKIIEINTP